MNFLIMLIVGGIAGWLASMVMRTDGQQGIILNVVVGIIGGFLGGLLLPMVGLSFGGGGPPIGTFGTGNNTSGNFYVNGSPLAPTGYTLPAQ